MARDVPELFKEGVTHERSSPVCRALTLRAAIARILAAALGLAAARQLMAQDAPAAGDDENIDEVVVTGTRVAARTRLDSLAPVDVLPQKR